MRRIKVDLLFILFFTSILLFSANGILIICNLNYFRIIAILVIKELIIYSLSSTTHLREIIEVNDIDVDTI